MGERVKNVCVVRVCVQEPEEWRRLLDTAYEVSDQGRVRNAHTARLCKVESSPRAGDRDVYVRLRVTPELVQRRLALRNLVAVTWPRGGAQLEMRLDAEGRAVQGGPRVVHDDGDPTNNAATNLRVMQG